VTALVLLTAVAVNLPVNGGVLWLACRLLKVGPDARGVSYWRAFSIVVTIFLLGWLLLAAVLAALRPFISAPLPDLAVYVLPPLGVVVPLTILKYTLGAGWWRTIGAFVVWRVLTLAHVGPTWLLIRPYVLEALAGR
jgi:hypothetical protein